MRKQVFGRRLKRDKNERKALFNGLISSMLLNGSIKTTEEKAKSIRADVEKLVTKAKKGNGAARALQKSLKPREIEKLVKEIAPGFKSRNGGYTRMVRLGRRFNDNASMVLMQWVEREVTEQVKKPESAKPAKKSLSSVKTSPKKSAKTGSRRVTKGKQK